MEFGLGLSLRKTRWLSPFLSPFPTEGMLQWLGDIPEMNVFGDFVIIDKTIGSKGDIDTVPKESNVYEITEDVVVDTNTKLYSAGFSVTVSVDSEIQGSHIISDWADNKGVILRRDWTNDALNLIIDGNSSGYFYSDYFNQDSKVVRLTLAYDGSGNWTVSDEDATLITVTGVTPDFENDTYLIFGNGVEPLPMDNIVANYVMQDGVLVDKVGGAGQELLFPCFYGTGAEGISNIESFALSDGKFIEFSMLAESQGAGTEASILRSNSLYQKLSIPNDATLNIEFQNGFSCSFPNITSKIIDKEVVLKITRSGDDYTLDIDGIFDQTSTADTGHDDFVITDIAGNITKPFKGKLYNINLNNEYHYPLTGHAYGFQSDGTPIIGTPSDSTCFEGLCNYNPEEGYNIATSGNNLVIPQSKINPLLDVEDDTLVDFLGGNAMPPYAVLNTENLTGDHATVIQAIMDRDGAIIDPDNQAFGYHGDPLNQYWNISTLLRGSEFLSSLNKIGWQVFTKTRSTDKALEGLTIYIRSENSFYVEKSSGTMLDTFKTILVDKLVG